MAQRSPHMRTGRCGGVMTAGWLAGLALLGALAQPALARESFGNPGYWLPQNVSSFGHLIDQLFYAVLWMTGVVGVAVFALLLWLLVRYRARPGRHAVYIQGNNRLELAWTLVPAILLALTAAASQSTWTHIKQWPQTEADNPHPPIEIEIVAQQFIWNFRYPGADGRFGPRQRELIDDRSADPAEQIGLDRSHPDAADDLVTQRLVIPVNRDIYIHLTSTDVLHSFFLPNFRMKQDAVPGLTGRLWLRAEKTSGEIVGRYADGSDKPFDIVCAELCGQGHFRMRGRMYVVTEEQYQAFLEEEAAFLVTDDDDFYY
jgi:cytochrome c oxidase subunit II